MSDSNVKKAFQPIVELMQANPDVKVKTLLPEVLALVSAKKGGGGGKANTFHRDADGAVVAARCYYFNKWFLTSEVEFGAKASSASGLNSMCKLGLSQWTKQQNTAKKAKEQLLTDVASGVVPHSELTERLQQIELERDAIIDLPEGVVGYETLEELQAATGIA